MARASKVGCNDNDLRRRGSAVRDAQGYANRHRACSNRNALPVSLTRLSRQSAAQSSCRTIKVRSAASCQSRSIIMRLRSSRRPAICSRRALTTACKPRVTVCPTVGAGAWPLVTSNGSDAHSFARAARGCASGPASRMPGRADQHGCGSRDAGRWP